jgi:hypothetical protein
MKNIPLFPRRFSWLSAVLLYVFLGAWTTFVAMVLPRLYALLEESPRLAFFGFLTLWLSPIAFVAVGHHVVHAFLDRADSGTKVARGALPGLGSLWAGVYAWLVIVLASSGVALFMLVLFPPPPPDQLSTQLMTMFAWPFDGRGRAGIHTLTWVVVAAQLYDLERAIKERAKRGDV